jgi:hypothetical protein
VRIENEKLGLRAGGSGGTEFNGSSASPLVEEVEEHFLHVINAKVTCPVDNILTEKIALASNARYV